MFKFFKRKKNVNIDRNESDVMSAINAQLNILSQETVDMAKFVELSASMTNSVYAMMNNN